MSEIDPVEVGVGASARIQEQFDDEPAPRGPMPAGTKKAEKAEREGLPPGYRMRADAHYVEHLTSRRSDRAAADISRVAPETGDRLESRERGDRLLAQLSEDMITIESAVGALAGDASRLSRRVNVDLIKSQVWRAAWSLRAHAILDGTFRNQIRPRPLAFLLGQVRTGWTPECRLLGVTLNVRASDWNAVVSVDEQSVIAGLTGAMVATLGVLGQADGAAITLEAVGSGGELRHIDVVQDEVFVAPGISGRFFDATWGDRPGGWFAGLGAATAKAVAQQHGGEVVFLAGERHGSTVRLQFTR